MCTLNHKPFHFKQFSINHHNSTMKVGTDAILLSVWCDVSNARTILDIGTGSGIIALLIASRSMAIVDAVELDQESVNEAQKNFQNSPYSNRLNIYHVDFDRFAVNPSHKYDIIITNPPFFSNDLLPDNPSRKAARHTNKLSHTRICEGVVKILSKDGRFNIVLPSNISNEFVKLAFGYGLHLYRQQLVFPKPSLKPNRINMEFRFDVPLKVISEEIIIRDEDGNHTNQYRKYVADYLMRI